MDAKVEEVSFPLVASLFYTWTGVFEASDSDRAFAATQYSQQRSLLIARVGLVKDYWCTFIPSAIWFSSEPRLYAVMNFSESTPRELLELVFSCGSIVDLAEDVLDGRDLYRCLDSVDSAMRHSMALADLVAQRANAGASVPEQYYRDSLAECKRQYQDARATFLRFAQRGAQFSYFEGMLVGAAVLAVAATALVFLAPSMPRVDVHAVDIVAGCIFGGALGAIFSVLSRMTMGRLRLKHDAGKKMLRILGGVRPVVGAVAGVGLFLFIDGQAFDLIKKPDGSARDYSYYAALAFLAGFSERFFQDMLVARGSTERSRADDQPDDAEAPPPGGAAHSTGLTEPFPADTTGPPDKVHPSREAPPVSAVSYGAAARRPGGQMRRVRRSSQSQRT